MSGQRPSWRVISMGLGLALVGCGPKDAGPKKITRIGPAEVAEAAAQAQIQPPPPLPAAPAAPKAEDSGRRRAKSRDASAGSLRDVELEPGQQLFSAMPPSAPAGLPFAVDGPDAETNVDRFVFVPDHRGVDSSGFAYSKGSATAESSAWTMQLRDESRTAYDLPDSVTPLESAGYSLGGLPWRVRCEEDGAVMALVPEGIFIQGRNKGPRNAAPEHGVLLDAFYIDLREVTYARYEKFRETLSEKRRVPRPVRVANDPQDPVLGVTWAEAHAFAVWAGKDLPYEAQWEKAARGVEGFEFPWGNGPAVWHRPRAVGQIDPVGAFRGDISPYGAFDMAGNAREWCNDWYAEGYYAQLVAESGSTARNPTGPKGGGGNTMRVVKGGDPNWHVWARAGVVQSERPSDVGFRCVLKVKPTGGAGKERRKAAR